MQRKIPQITPEIIKSFELTEAKDAIEIWVRMYPKVAEEESILTCMYLFPYDNGIVRIK